MTTKTTTMRKGCDIRSRELLPQGNGDTGIAAELQWVSSPQEEARYFPGTAPHGGARDEDAEVPSLEALIQAVLNSNP